MDQFILALIGVTIAVVLTGIGSAVGLGMTTKAATGVLSEKPDLFGKLLVLQALPSSNGIYGFLVAILIMTEPGMPFGPELAAGAVIPGMKLLMASLPIGIVGLVGGISQSKAASSSIYMTGKRPELSARGIVMSSMNETYPILALLVSVLIIFL